MRRLLPLMSLALLPLSLLPVAPALADQMPAPELTLAGYEALSEDERTLYLSGVSDALDYAAGGSENLTVIAACINGFDGATLRETIDGAEPALDWPDESPAAAWAIATMIQVCQLQLSPE